MNRKSTFMFDYIKLYQCGYFLHIMLEIEQKLENTIIFILP